ncbi:hypothetical protein BIW11_03078 [Tropilaelaps mercedesae]|uniref:Uncharacterized protein n=1 Tax=Tropilaelaps mercedesae TaxID=418985 RepID=A0A1V9XSE2_9ACAR|nr:hypothetical protein BIW11_03078 [Tropilaelaps mercedesae]
MSSNHKLGTRARAYCAQAPLFRIFWDFLQQVVAHFTSSPADGSLSHFFSLVDSSGLALGLAEAQPPGKRKGVSGRLQFRPTLLISLSLFVAVTSEIAEADHGGER